MLRYHHLGIPTSRTRPGPVQLVPHVAFVVDHEAPVELMQIDS